PRGTEQRRKARDLVMPCGLDQRGDRLLGRRKAGHRSGGRNRPHLRRRGKAHQDRPDPRRAPQPVIWGHHVLAMPEPCAAWAALGVILVLLGIAMLLRRRGSGVLLRRRPRLSCRRGPPPPVPRRPSP